MKYLVLDGNSILNRAFYGIRMLSNKKGQMTNAIYGFLATMQKLMSETSPNAVAVAFDLPAPTFRHKMYDGYKANRKKMPEELVSQLPILKNLLVQMGYKLVELAGYEADDVLGTFAKHCQSNNYECVLATGDRDSLQLVDNNVTVRIAKTKMGKPEAIIYTKETVLEEYGVLPNALIDIKALQGDASDNIPGVKGVGEKTAKELIQKFGSIKNIYENIDTLDIKQSVKLKLQADEKMAKLSYGLGTINKDVPITINDQDYIPLPMNKDAVKETLTELEFFTFIEKLNLNTSQQKKSISASEIDGCAALNVIKQVKSGSKIPFFISGEKNSPENLYFAVGDDFYVVSAQSSGFDEFLSEFLSSENFCKATHDIKRIYKLFYKSPFKIKGELFDVMLAAYLLNPSAKDYSVLRIAQEYDVATASFSAGLQHHQNLETVYYISSLLEPIAKKLQDCSQTDLLVKIEQPLAEVLAGMEAEGFVVDKQALEEYAKKLTEQINELQGDIYELAGTEFNLNSPKQLGEILFEKLNLPKGKKGKTGYSTSAATLEKLRGYHQIVDMILKYREMAKLKSTYCDGMIGLITKNGRIHSSFNQTETRTGRISSTEPNLQNIPVRTERGREMRKFFKASEGCVLIDADYSQIELRVMAHISGDENMINAFNNDDDIHAITASQIFGVPLNMVTSQMRARAKAVNFGILYGMGAFSLAQDLQITRFEAQNYINRYLGHYSAVDDYMQHTIDLAKANGYAETIFNRRRYLPELESTNHMLRAFGERVARNMPIQGSAADIIKIAMINVYNKLKKIGTNAKLILQVHDELIVEAPINQAQAVKDMLKFEMENALKLKVPLKVNLAQGETWFDAKS